MSRFDREQSITLMTVPECASSLRWRRLSPTHKRNDKGSHTMAKKKKAAKKAAKKAKKSR